MFCDEYDNSEDFIVCIADRGQGFKSSLEQKHLTFPQQLLNWGEGKLIKAAVKGQSGAGSRQSGRGQGLKSVLESTKRMQGNFYIYSGRGMYSYDGGKESASEKKWYYRYNAIYQSTDN